MINDKLNSNEADNTKMSISSKQKHSGSAPVLLGRKWKQDATAAAVATRIQYKNHMLQLVFTRPQQGEKSGGFSPNCWSLLQALQVHLCSPTQHTHLIVRVWDHSDLTQK